MLDPWIIEEILKREEEQRREQERGRIELPIEGPPHSTPHSRTGEYPPIKPQESGRGVVTIDI